MTDFSWTDERVETLTKLWVEGFSAQQIAVELEGVSRSAVIGKANRLGLSEQHQRATRLREKATPQKTRRVTNPLGNKLQKMAQQAPAATPATPPPESSDLDNQTKTAPETTGVSLDNLNGGCAWPLGEPGTSNFSYCGAKTKPGKSYCPYHLGIAYEPPQTRKPKARKAGNMGMQSSWYA